jgi:hypothetical protein
MATATDLNAIYSNADNTPAILPYVQPSMRDSNEILTVSSVTTIISSLKTANALPVLSNDKQKNQTTVNEYEIAIDKFMKNARAEYNFYNALYKTALEKLFSSIRNGYSNPSPDNTANVTTNLGHAKKLNIKLNDLVQILKGTSDDMVASSADMQAKIKKMNEDVSHIKTQLNRQGEIIKSSQGVTKINKEMMKYTEEKGRYTDNLLKMYSFLNIVAFGLLIYIYRAAN